jgi:hypothetical protein
MNRPRACPGPITFPKWIVQEAAGDSLGASSDGLDRSGADGLDRSGAVDAPAGVDAAGLLQAAMAPMRARASRILLIMKSLLGLRPAGGSSGAGPAV